MAAVCESELVEDPGPPLLLVFSVLDPICQDLCLRVSVADHSQELSIAQALRSSRLHRQALAMYTGRQGCWGWGLGVGLAHSEPLCE